ncbi:hypothetical protein [Bartonella sp. DGB1]|uniref:hypothetical protein n=1 Tax=Bartonella sp. DGB1 TaxID=3239807 RepID=UPI0035269E2E
MIKSVAEAFAKSYRKQIVIGAIVPILAGILADKIGTPLAFLICSIVGFLLASLLILYLKRPNFTNSKKSSAM